MNTTYATTTATEQRSYRGPVILAVLVIALVAGLISAYALTRPQPIEGPPTTVEVEDTTSGGAGSCSQRLGVSGGLLEGSGLPDGCLAPGDHPFVDGFVPAQPM